jgi:hypothetical protein
MKYAREGWEIHAELRPENPKLQETGVDENIILKRISKEN